LLCRAVRREGEPASRRRLSAGLQSVLASLVFVAFAGRAFSYASDDRVFIEGTGGMLCARSDVARQIETIAATVRRETHPGDGLIVFPEGEIINFLSGQRNPIRHMLYLPGYVTASNEPEILSELERAKPGAVILWPRPLGEYGSGAFGQDYGQTLGGWIERRYRLAALPNPSRSGPRLWLRVDGTPTPP
jgi:hypothetical protein